MIYNKLAARLELLFSQGRYAEAEQMLHGHLEEFPMDEYAQYMLAVTYFSQDKLEDAEQVVDSLISENPSEHGYLGLSARIDIAKDLLPRAEEKIEMLIAADPEEPEYYNLMANVRFKERDYDKALFFAEKALLNDPENLQALNLRSTVSGILGRNDAANVSIHEALQQDPENDWTIANHGQQLLREGKVKEALERFQDALSKNPNNDLAQYGLKEALKSRFWPYKMFYKYQMLMSRMTSGQMWGLMIGAYVLLRFLGRAAEKNPEYAVFLNPLVYLIVAIFLSTWIIQPLMNLYLLTNKYGRLLLDKEDKLAAKLVGVSLSLAILLLLASFLLSVPGLQLVALFFIALMIPLGTMYNPPSKKGKQQTVLFTLGILICGLVGGILKLTTDQDIGIIIAFGGIFIYQWVLNGIMIKGGARRISR